MKFLKNFPVVVIYSILSFYFYYNLNIETNSFDKSKKKFVYAVKNKTWTESATELINQKISQIKYSAKLLLNETDWYITRQAEGIKDAPTEIIEARKKIRDEADAEIKEINKLSKKADIVGFKSELR